MHFLPVACHGRQMRRILRTTIPILVSVQRVDQSCAVGRANSQKNGQDKMLAAAWPYGDGNLRRTPGLGCCVVRTVSEWPTVAFPGTAGELGTCNVGSTPHPETSQAASWRADGVGKTGGPQRNTITGMIGTR